MFLWVLGINHTSAPLDFRGRFVFPAEQTPEKLLDLQSRLGAQLEAVLLSTCNRTEIYLATAEDAHLAHARDWLAQLGGVSLLQLQSHSYERIGSALAQHLFEVAAGLDSMVLGETQILGQLKEALRLAQRAGTVGGFLHPLFQRAFAAAKDIRSNTEIGAHTVSMAAAAVRLANALFEDWARLRILFVGAGEMIELVMTHFAAQRPAHLCVANRSIERARALTARCGGEVMHLSEIPSRLHEFDIVISCTASTLPMIGLGAVQQAIKARHHRPMLMVDLAVPRDIEPEVKMQEDIYLYTLDDLAQVVQTGQAQRLAAQAQAQTLLQQALLEWEDWCARRSAGNIDLIQEIQAQTHAWREAEMDKARKQLDKGERAEVVMANLAQSLSQKMLHGAYQYLHHAPEQERAARQAALEQIFLRKSE